MEGSPSHALRLFRAGRNLYIILLLLLLGIGIGSCARVISKSFREQVQEPVPFQALLTNPDAYREHRVILGGYIVDNSAEEGYGMLTILQAPLNRLEEPGDVEKSQGRFIIRSKRFLDPEVYAKTRKVTVGGAVDGVLRKQLGNSEYAYPVIDAEELYLWPRPVERYYSPIPPYGPLDWPWYDWYAPWPFPPLYWDRFHHHHRWYR